MRERETLPYGASTYSKSWVAWGRNDPLYVSHGQGWRIFDASGSGLCDCVMGLGSVIVGHCNPRVDNAIRRSLTRGTSLSLGSNTELEAAQRVLKYFPAGSMLQWGVNGSDATEGACRLARLVTGRDVIAKHEKGYHGFHDWCLAGDVVRGHGIPDFNSNGFYPTVTFPSDIKNSYLDTAEGQQYVAAVIIEPDLEPSILKPIRDWCDKTGALMICDEVMTWARYPDMTASAYYGVVPDLWCLGKALGNGMPVSAIVGTAKVISRFAPMSSKPNAFFSSSWAGHPLSLAAVIATLDVLEKHDDVYRIWKRADELHMFLHDLHADHRERLSSLKDIGERPFNRITWHSPAVAQAWRRLMREAGVLIYAAHNLSLAHDDNAMKRIIDAWHYVVQHADRLDAASTETCKGSGIMRR